MEELSQQAISAALAGDWEKALTINLKLLKAEGVTPDILNRIARSYTELGEIKKAKKYAQKALDLDPYNAIARKILQRISLIAENGSKPGRTKLAAVSFLEEPGKTKIVSLINLCATHMRLSLDSGIEVKLVPHSHSLTITTFPANAADVGNYLGRLPDDLAVRISRFIKEGNEYAAYIKCASSSEIKVFLREVKRAVHIAHIPSFPAEKFHYVAFTAPELVHNQKSSTSR